MAWPKLEKLGLNLMLARFLCMHMKNLRLVRFIYCTLGCLLIAAENQALGRVKRSAGMQGTDF